MAHPVTGWHMTLKAELVEQSFLRHPPFTHHLAALHPRTTESGLHTRGNDDFFNGIGPVLTLGRPGFGRFANADKQASPFVRQGVRRIKSSAARLNGPSDWKETAPSRDCGILRYG